MAQKYAPLTRHLLSSPAPEIVIDFDALSAMVGGLPPSSGYPAWWANTAGNTQARGWLSAGRTAKVDLINRRVSFVVTGARLPTRTQTDRRSGGTVLMDGVDSLMDVLRKAGYPSVVSAVAEYTVFLDPRTVAQTNGKPVFPVVRDLHRRGQFDSFAGGQKVLLDDNTTPTLAFLWAASRRKGPDVQYNHVWTDAKSPALYTALWNICATPAFLAKTTDGRNHPEVRAALQYRALELYGVHAPGNPPRKPQDYDDLHWAAMPEPVANLEATYRSRLQAAPKSPPAIAASTIGWLYSDWKPDRTIVASASAVVAAVSGDEATIQATIESTDDQTDD